MHNHNSVRWGHTVIHFDYHYRRRKTLAISVHPNLRVEVIAPTGTTLEDIRGKVCKRGPWIQKNKRQFELLLPASAPRSYVNGESHYYLGRRYRLRAESGDSNSVKLHRGRLLVTVKGKLQAEKIGRLVVGWYRERAKTLFKERIELLLSAAQRESLPAPRLQIRTMKTRWGSCSVAGLVTLNLFLLRAPKECIDYVIAHELCHLKEAHHGPRFWKMLQRIMSDYQVRKDKLEKFSQMIAH